MPNMSGAYGLQCFHPRTPEARQWDGRLRSGACSWLPYSSLIENKLNFQTSRTWNRALLTTASVVSEDKGAVISDSAVPEGHRELHGFLYGEGGAEVHNVFSSDRFDPIQGEDDGTALMPLAAYLRDRENKRLIGVYALYDSHREVQYVGYARNFIQLIKAHLKRVGEERCSYVRAMVFANKAMATRTALAQQAENWLHESGTIPPGNGMDRHLWEGNRKSGMTADEAALHHDAALKMQKAMGENLQDAQPGEDLDAQQRRLYLIRAVEGDDWSAVIGQQNTRALGHHSPGVTREQNLPESLHEPKSQQQMATPFARAPVHRSIGNMEPAMQEMTVQSVDAALEEVRPYLIADGGNVEVVDVTNGFVLLRLQGACGTCPSSAATMKMGIERALRAAFGDALKAVEQIGVQDIGASSPAVEAHLESLRPAIASYGGLVKVLAVESGVCKVEFSGPKPIGMGIQAAIRDRFPDIRSVILLDP
eukprot:jgi/Botrbrau1/4030/Bobra.0016s0037.1